MGSYEYLEHEAIADVAFRAYGDDLEDLFYQAATATASLQTDLDKLDSDETRELKLTKNEIEKLLKSLLDEILYYKDAELLFATDFEFDIDKEDDTYHLTGKLIGGYFDHDKHPMHNDLKAITWHKFKVEKVDSGWQCYVLIDI